MNGSRYEAIIATLVGVSALLVSAYTAYVQRQQVRAQVLPIVETQGGYNGKEAYFGVTNKGIGPALVRDVRLSIDGTTVRTWPEFVNVVAGPAQKRRIAGYASMGQTTLTGGEHTITFRFPCSVAPAPDGGAIDISAVDEQCRKVMDAIQRQKIDICFCSTLDDCWNYHDAPGADETTTPVARCPKRDDTSFQ